MTTLYAIAHAKLNLTLDVVGRRPDGYHNLEMVMQEITLGDEVTLTLGTGKPWALVGEGGEMPRDDSNIAWRAAALFFEAAGMDCEGLTVEIQKRTPVCAGMGGGSADGAAVLRLLQDYYGRPIPEETLYAIAEQVGSDVPFALFGGTALAREKGQILTRLSPFPHCEIVLCKPNFPISTPALFRAVDRAEITRRPDTKAMTDAIAAGDLVKAASLLCNVFEPIVEADHPEIREIRETMLSGSALGAAMTGSGPTVFGLFEDPAAAKAVYETLRPVYPDTFLTAPV